MNCDLGGDCKQVDKFADFGERLVRLETQQTADRLSMQQNQSATMTFLDRTEKHLTTLIDELKEIVIEKHRVLDYAINGNGKPGIMERLRGLESDMEGMPDRLEDAERAIAANTSASDALQENRRRNWDYIKPFIPYFIITVGLAVGGYLAGVSKGH